MKTYRSFDEFTREEIRPLTRVGFTLDEFDIDNDYKDESFLFDDSSADDEDDE